MAFSYVFLKYDIHKETVICLERVLCIQDNISSLFYGSLLPRASMTLEIPPFRIFPQSVEINVSAVFRHVQKQYYAGTRHVNKQLSFILQIRDLVVVYFVNTFALQVSTRCTCSTR